MTDLIGYVIRGIPFGCVFALVAIGLVLTYKTSGVFNLAFAAQAFVSAAVYYQLRDRGRVAERPGVPRRGGRRRAAARPRPRTPHLPPSAHRAARSRSSSPRWACWSRCPQIVNLWIGSDAKYGVPTIWPNQFGIYRWGDYAIDGNEAATVIATRGRRWWR